MEIREFAEKVLLSCNLQEKLVPIRQPVTDENPGTPLRVEEPGRPENLIFAPRRKAPAMPKPAGFGDPLRRAIAHHIMANHELQALEVMASVLCAFPDAPAEFRSGMVNIMIDEQRHTKLHVDQAEKLGAPFGSLPVNCYIWKKSLSFDNVMQYLAGLPLTFEGRNLDHAQEFERHFETAGDPKSAAIMKTIHRDEIQHVSFGIQWLRKLKPPEQSDWDAYVSNLKWPLRPSKSKGYDFCRKSRLAAGLSPEFIQKLDETDIDIET
jgi:uncharacterized ferritin-like protein (DUF455 family)